VEGNTVSRTFPLLMSIAAVIAVDAALCHQVGAADPTVQTTLVTIDDRLVECANRYRAAIEDYRRGDRTGAASAVARLHRADLGRVVAVLHAVRQTPRKYAAPGRATDLTTRAIAFRWDSRLIIAAGTFHLEASADAFDQDLARVLFATIATPLPGEPDELKRRGALSVGFYLLYTGDVRAASGHLSAAIKRWPNAATLLLTCATAFETEATGPYRVAQAEPAIGRPPGGGLTSDDQNPSARELSIRADLLRRAAVLLERVVSLTPASAEARVRLAHVRILLGDAGAAADGLAAALDANVASEWRYVALLLLAQIREGAAELDAAKALFEQAIAQWPTSQAAFVGLTHVLALQGQPQSAESVLERLFDPSVEHRDPWETYALGRRAGRSSVLQRLKAEFNP
jgi:thioredoxin-like negative regulator of GroEL